MSLDSYSKEQHFHELARKDSLNNSLNFPVGLATLIAGGIAFLSKAINFPFDDSEWIQLLLIAISSSMLLVACYLLARAYWNYGYGHMPTAIELNLYAARLKDYYLSLGASDDDAKNNSDADTANYITAQFAKNASTNASCNDKKSSYLFKANGFVIASIVPLIICAPFHVYNESISKKEPFQVEIIQSKGASMTNQDKPEAPPPPPPTQQVLPRPEPPPSRIIKEHVDPTKK